MPPNVSVFNTLAQAVRKNDTAEAARILAASPDVRTRLNDPMPDGAFGATLLLAAVHHDNRDMAELLLDAGADINQRSHWWAGSFGVLDHDGSLSEFLISRGAIVDAHAYGGAVEMLLDAGAPLPRISNDVAASDAVRDVLIRRGLL